MSIAPLNTGDSIMGTKVKNFIQAMLIEECRTKTEDIVLPAKPKKGVARIKTTTIAG